MNLRRRANGVGMVEVMVALIILSIGMLGTATLFVSSMQAKTTALSRMQAINLANDIADRIRANRTATTGYALTESAAAATPGTNCVQTTSTAATSCTPAQMAVSDLFYWDSNINDALSGKSPKRSITVTAATTTVPTTYTIELKWQEPTSGELSFRVVVQI